jgi:Collagen triple helix repeat (20 copies)
MLRTIGAVAVVALLLAAATAGAQSLFDGGDIRNNSLTGADIKNGSVQVSDLSRSARRALQGARGARGPRGPQGLPGAQGIAGAPGVNGLNGVTAVTYHDGATQTTDPVSGIGGATAACPPGAVALSVGFGPATGTVLLEHIEIVNEVGGFVLGQSLAGDVQPVQARVACARR